MVRKEPFGTKILQLHHAQTLNFGETWSSDGHFKTNQGDFFEFHAVLSFWCYPTLVGGILQTGASISIWRSWSPTENFIDLIRSKSNLLRENGPSSILVFHLQYFLIRINISFEIFGLHIFIYGPGQENMFTWTPMERFRDKRQKSRNCCCLIKFSNPDFAFCKCIYEHSRILMNILQSGS